MDTISAGSSGPHAARRPRVVHHCFRSAPESGAPSYKWRRYFFAFAGWQYCFAFSSVNHKVITTPTQQGSDVLRPVCLSVRLSVCEHISGTAGPIFTKFVVQIPCGRGSVHLWQRCQGRRQGGGWWGCQNTPSAEGHHNNCKSNSSGAGPKTKAFAIQACISV